MHTRHACASEGQFFNMNKAILNKYGITFTLQSNGTIKTTAISPNLDIYVYMYSKSINELIRLVDTLDTVLAGNYNLINYDDREWSREIGYKIYTGIIQDDLTFDLFLEDHYENTLETFPLLDIREIFNSLLEFMQ